ncbi:MAG: bifunctional (p)ppGpp synthetase/guanosine-3',5'-bis(diphosphate) 3'-pyrophosphohydrolase [Chloroherpetonaceae bacterium]|nr:bifunctional (p)ppGpp synthetase/guanosine-3',5'-bis(diphosphate) 3'-pyrophosphohydrolase [Chloroherpetonaceae bacterium]
MSQNADLYEDVASAPASDVDEVMQRVLSNLARYRPQADTDLVCRAFAFAREKHAPQKRLSGDPYIIHPVEVAEILTELELDEHILAAGLLHDVIEDCGVTVEDLARDFGPDVAHLVEGVTKLQIAGVDEGKPREASPDDEEEVTPATAQRRLKQAETARKGANLRKLFVAIAKDMRVILIKLADRLHNMRTLYSLPPGRQLRIAAETLEIYAPLAHRLGIWQWKWQLEDLAFKYVDPEAYARVAALVARNRRERQQEVDEAIAILSAKLKEHGIDAQVMGRPKHLYSIYNKMRQQNLNFEDLYDLTALRVIVHTWQECYHALGVVSALWVPIPGMLSDYIAHRKSNMYQSIHIKVSGPSGRPLEVQIRTWEMHRTAEFGVAAHWQYKEGGDPNDQFERRLAFLRQQLFDWQADSRDPNEFLRNVTEDLIPDQVFARTPKGDIVDLPKGSTPVDFAYRIHSAIGDHTVGAKVNGRMVPLNYQLNNGDVVEIITRPNAAPSRDWLAFVKSSHARSRIRSYFRRLNYDENVQHGRDLLEKELAHQLQQDPKGWGDDPRSLLRDEALKAIAPLFNMPSEQELLAAIGYGTLSALSVLNRLKPSAPSAVRGLQIGGRKSQEEKHQIVVGGLQADNMLFRRSRCCLPIPGDDVIGYITRGKGMALHRRECPNAQNYLQKEPDRCMPVEYIGNAGQVYQVYLIIETIDRMNLLADVGSVFGENKTNITSVRTQSHRDKTATLELAVEVRNTEHLATIIQKVRSLGDILNVQRATGALK